MTDTQFVPLGAVAAPADWTLPPALNILVKNAYASFDGTLASGSFIPTLELISDSGHTIGAYPCSTTVAAGGSADVTWAPFLRTGGAGSSFAVTEYTSPGTYTWTKPSGIKVVTFDLISGGGGGAAGKVGAAGTTTGGGGGGGSAVWRMRLNADYCPATLTVTVGAGGAGATLAGGNGSNGTPSSIADPNNLNVGNVLLKANVGGGGTSGGGGGTAGTVGATFLAGALQAGVPGTVGGTASNTTGGNGGNLTNANLGGASGGGAGGSVNNNGGAAGVLPDWNGNDTNPALGAAGTNASPNGADGGITPEIYNLGGKGGGGGVGSTPGHGGKSARGGGGGGGGGIVSGTPGVGGNGGDGYVRITVE